MEHHATQRAPDDEAYWDSVRAQYAVAPEFINLENAFFGVQATPVFEAYQRQLRQVHLENAYFMRERMQGRGAEVVGALAAFGGVEPEELVLTRNLIEAINIVFQGYPFRAGDEVVLASHDYPSVMEMLEMVAARKALTLRMIDIPFDPDSDQEIVAAYQAALTPATRVLLVTHISNRTGQIMPVAKICAMARRHGVDVVVDAAHSFAHLDYRIAELGADFVAVNLHKWLGAPLAVGMLYIRKARIAEIAPLFGDTRHPAGDIGKLAHFGTVPPAPVLNVLDALAFHQSIGSANKEARLRYLKEYWVSRARAIGGVEFLTPRDPRRSCAIAVVAIAGLAAADLAAQLMDRYRIFTVTREVAGRSGVRITPHLYTSLAELDLLVRALGEMAATKNIRMSDPIPRGA